MPPYFESGLASSIKHFNELDLALEDALLVTRIVKHSFHIYMLDQEYYYSCLLFQGARI